MEKNTKEREGKRYQILNTYVDAISMDETIVEIEKIIARRKPTQHVDINASQFMSVN